MNRVSHRIAKLTTQLAERGLSKERLAEFQKSLDMSFEEHASFQNLKSLAVHEGKLTLEEGQLVYNLLGNTVSVFNRQPPSVKHVLTVLYGELLNREITRRKGRRRPVKQRS